MYRDEIIRAVWAVCLGLMMITGVGRAEDGDRAPVQNLPAAVEQPSNPVGAPARVSHHSAGSEWSDCNCPTCRINRCWDQCWLHRQAVIHHHDKQLFHWYIRGNGPAIHTRPAGLYWW